MQYEIISLLAGAIVVAFAILKTGAMLKRGKRTIDVENLAWETYKKNVVMSDLMRQEAYKQLERAEDRRKFEEEYMQQKRKEWELNNKTKSER